MCERKTKYTIDLTSVKTYFEMHLVIRESLDFPDYYGCNAAAFWDCLTDMYGDRMEIEIRGLENIKRRFPEYADTIVTVLKRFKHNYNDKFSDDITIKILLENGYVELN